MYLPVIDKTTKIYKRTDFNFNSDTEVQVQSDIPQGIHIKPDESPTWTGSAWIESISSATQSEIDNANSLAITAKATSYIEERYSPLKQRKLMSIAIALQDKQIQGQTLTTEEQALLQTCRDSNTWITSVRTVENTAIANNTKLIDVVWPA